MKINKLLLAGGLGLCIVLFLSFKLSSSHKRDVISAMTSPAMQGENSQSASAKPAAVSGDFTELTPQRLRDQIMALLSSGNPYDQNKVYNDLVPALVRMDPKAAAAFAQSLNMPQWRSDMMMVVAQTWATLNPDDAQSWASHLPPSPGDPLERDTMVSYVCFSIANTDANRAVQVLEQCPINAPRLQIMVENLAQQWADSDLQPLENWVATLPAGPERDDYFARVANAEARSDPQKAAAIVSTEIAPGAAQDEAAVNVVKQWAWNDSSSATEWVNAFPSGDLHDRAQAALAETIAHRKGSD
jgi:hypothetical protein